MSCPSEDTFARFLEGLLAPPETAAIEQHVDGCARCADLAAAFGRSFAEEAAPARGLWVSPPVLLAVSATIQIVWAVVLWRSPAALEAVLPSAAAAGYRAYATLWGPLGAAVAAAAAVALARGRRWGRALALVQAALSLPSIVMTPLAVYLLMTLRGRDSAPPAAS
jgi:hypothetical protein